MRDDASPLLAVDGLTVHYPVKAGLLSRTVGTVRAVDGVSFSLRRGETLALVGESGCGKSSTALAVTRLIPATGGSIRLGDRDLLALGAGELKASRRRLQIVFQDPYSSLNPRHRVGDIIRAPLDIHAIGSPAERRARVGDLMHRVGLRPDQADQFPHQFSGGQRQRIGIARALAVGPDVIVCDEPVSALDVSIQAQILNLLTELQRELGLAYLFISHDLGVVRHIADRVAVMYLGRIVEIAPRDVLFDTPRHPYTQELLASAPPAHPRQRREWSGEASELPASTGRPPAGCAFHPRCPLADAHCRAVAPGLAPRDDGRLLACHRR
jgi:oligopeptide/dipeptide ABC transporter ATP-binding protein